MLARLILAAVLAALSTAGAQARDWSGFYAGGHAGYGTTGFDGFDAFKAFFPSEIGDINTGAPVMSTADFWALMTDDCLCNVIDEDTDDFIFGLAGGYNWQSGNYVYGVELTAFRAQFEGIGAIDALYPPFGPPGPLEASGLGGYIYTIDNVFTATGRVGYSFDRLLVSGFAGIAATRAEWTSIGFLVVDGPGGDGASVAAFEGAREWVLGWVLGIGAEYALTDTISLRLDYRHIGFEGFSPTGVALSGVTVDESFSPSTDFSADLVTLGINLRF